MDPDFFYTLLLAEDKNKLSNNKSTYSVDFVVAVTQASKNIYEHIFQIGFPLNHHYNALFNKYTTVIKT